MNVGYKEHFEMININESKTGLLALSKDNIIQYHFIEVMRCIFSVLNLKLFTEIFKRQVVNLAFELQI